MSNINVLRKIVLGYACAIALTGAAHSADAVVEVPVVDVPVISWTGGYVGLNAGYSWGDLDQTATIDPFTLGFSFPGFSRTYGGDTDGWSGGIQGGYNWQVDNFVLGVEADIQLANIEGTVSGAETIPIFGPLTATVGVDTTTKLEWFGTARLRAGFLPTERLLVYGTGGFAYGKTKSTSALVASTSLFPNDPLVENLGSSSSTRTGWAAGAGAEYAIDANWSLKGEYLYTDLGDEQVYSFSADPIFGRFTNDLDFHTVRIGVNYHF